MIVKLVAAVLSAAAVAGTAHSQAFPSRPITMVIPYAPGGPSDGVGRLIADEMGKELKQPMVVQNKPGAGTTIGADFVSKSRNDGYTILVAPGSTYLTNPYLYKNLKFKAEEFEVIGTISKLPFVLEIAASIPARNVKEFVEWSKQKPGGATHGTPGLASTGHIMADILGEQLGIQFRQIHYQGTGPATNDLISGNIDAMLDGLGTAVQLHRAGRTRIIGTLDKTRWPTTPEIPTLIEQGYKDALLYAWFVLVAPAGTPKDVVDRLNKALTHSLNKSEVQERLQMLGQAALPLSPAGSVEFVRSEEALWVPAVKRAAIPQQEAR